MDIKLILQDTTEITLPPTLMVSELVKEPDYSLHRAPFGRVQVVAGDGLPQPEPFEISGKAYFGTAGQAEAWMKQINEALDETVAVAIGSEEIDIHALDYVALPVGLPRVISVNIRFFPKVVR